MLRWCCGLALAVALLTGCSSSPDDEEQDRDGPRSATATRENSDRPIACSKQHLAETVYVSEGAPPETSKALAPCRKAQSDYLGQDFNTRLDIQLWVAGDRSWYRCDVLLRNSTKSGAGFQSLTGSLKGRARQGRVASICSPASTSRSTPTATSASSPARRSTSPRS